MAQNAEAEATLEGKIRTLFGRDGRLQCKSSKLSTRLTLDAAIKLNLFHMPTHDLTTDSCNDLPKSATNSFPHDYFHRDPYISMLSITKSARYRKLNNFCELDETKEPHHTSFGILETSYRRGKRSHRYRNCSQVEATHFAPLLGSRHYSHSASRGLPYDLYYKRHPYVCVWRRGKREEKNNKEEEPNCNTTSLITVHKLLLPQLTKLSTKRLPNLPQPEVSSPELKRGLTLQGARKRSFLLRICRAKMHLLPLPHPRSKSVEKKNAETQCHDPHKTPIQKVQKSTTLTQPMRQLAVGPRVAKLLDIRGAYRYKPPSLRPVTLAHAIPDSHQPNLQSS